MISIENKFPEITKLLLLQNGIYINAKDVFLLYLEIILFI